MAEGTRASITCFHLAVAYVPAWSDIMLHITGELTAFSPLIPLQQPALPPPTTATKLEFLQPTFRLATCTLYWDKSQAQWWQCDQTGDSVRRSCCCCCWGCVSYLAWLLGERIYALYYRYWTRIIISSHGHYLHQTLLLIKNRKVSAGRANGIIWIVSSEW